jgi:hypothetical protein
MRILTTIFITLLIVGSCVLYVPYAIFSFAYDETKRIVDATKVETLVCHPTPEYSNPANDELVRYRVQATILHCTGVLDRGTPTSKDSVRPFFHGPRAEEAFFKYGSEYMDICLNTLGKSQYQCEQDILTLYHAAYGVEFDPRNHEDPDPSAYAPHIQLN